MDDTASHQTWPQVPGCVFACQVSHRIPNHPSEKPRIYAKGKQERDYSFYLEPHKRSLFTRGKLPGTWKRVWGLELRLSIFFSLNKSISYTKQGSPKALVHLVSSRHTSLSPQREPLQAALLRQGHSPLGWLALTGLDCKSVSCRLPLEWRWYWPLCGPCWGPPRSTGIPPIRPSPRAQLRPMLLFHWVFLISIYLLFYSQGK